MTRLAAQILAHLFVILCTLKQSFQSTKWTRVKAPREGSDLNPEGVCEAPAHGIFPKSFFVWVFVSYVLLKNFLPNIQRFRESDFTIKTSETAFLIDDHTCMNVTIVCIIHEQMRNYRIEPFRLSSQKTSGVFIYKTRQRARGKVKSDHLCKVEVVGSGQQSCYHSKKKKINAT